jgi:hypothetical protein
MGECTGPGSLTSAGGPILKICKYLSKAAGPTIMGHFSLIGDGGGGTQPPRKVDLRVSAGATGGSAGFYPSLLVVHFRELIAKSAGA